MAEEQSLRSIIASFSVLVDPEGNLAKGNAAVDGLKRKLEELTAAAKPAGDAVAAAFDKVGVARTGASSTLPVARGGLLASLRAKAGAGVASFKEGFNQSSGLSGAIGGLATLRNGIIALGAGAAVHALTGLVDRIGDISESAARLGVSVEEFQRLDVLAKQSGTSVGALGTAFRTLAGAAVDPTKESTAAFAKLGVTTKDTAGAFKSRQELFFDTAGALADVSDGTERAALAQKLFGRGATELLPLLANGRAGLEAQRAALEKLPVFTQATVEAADALSDSWKTLGPQLLAAAGPLITDLLIPGLKLATDFLFKLSKAVQKLTKDLDPVNVLLAGMSVYLSGVTTRLWAQAAAAAANGGGWAKMAGGVAKSVAQLAKAAAAFLIFEDVATFFKGGDSVTGRLMNWLFGEDEGAKIQQAAVDILNALKELFGFVQGNSISKLASDLGEALSYLTGTTSTQDYQAKRRASEQGIYAEQQRYIGLTGGANTIPLPPGQAGPPQATYGAPPSVTVGDQTVIINGVNPNNASAVAGAVRGELGRDRDAIITPYLVGGGA